MTAAILTEGLEKYYGDVQALHGVNLEVFPGETFAFLGPNGAGKTTMIRCMLDLIRPSSGTVRVLGIDPQTNPVEVCARSGYLPGDLRLEGNRTVKDLMKYFDALRGKKSDWKYIDQLLQRLNLDPQKKVKMLSKGNRQKVGVIQSLMHKPEILIMDEPTSALDPLVQQEVHDLINEARQEGTTVFFSSHIMSEVEAIAQRVGIIREGKLIKVSDIASLDTQSLNFVNVQFQETIDPKVFKSIPGVSISAVGDENSIEFQVKGDMNELIKALGSFHVIDLETRRSTLEEIFLTFYNAN